MYTIRENLQDYIISTLSVRLLYNIIQSEKFPSPVRLSGDPKWEFNKRSPLPVWRLLSCTKCLTFHMVARRESSQTPSTGARSTQQQIIIDMETDSNMFKLRKLEMEKTIFNNNDASKLIYSNTNMR